MRPRSKFAAIWCVSVGMVIARRTRSNVVSVDGARRDEILDAAASLFGSLGVHASLQQVAEACGILPGSLYHHFDSKDAIYIELVARYRAELDQIAERALDDSRVTSGPPLEQVVAL